MIIEVMEGSARLLLLGWRQLSSIHGFLLLLFLAVHVGTSVASGKFFDRALEEDRDSCFETVTSWSEEQLDELSSLPPESALDRFKMRDLLFFLHVPRTGGRTFHQCFLKHLLPSNQRCPRSYDKLRIDPTQPGCRLISTHDDYSLLESLPVGMTSVVTNLRDPLDRVLSSYEFSIEVAARSLRKRLRRLPTSSSRPKAISTKGGIQVMNTLDIWPWKYLVPTMETDLFARREARQVAGTNTSGLLAEDSYDAAAIAMPLEEFLDHPAAVELVHNGATFQVAGLTNTSYSVNAGEIRQCVIRFPQLGKLVVEVAKKRLDRMLYVGLTEEQNEAAVFMEKALKGQFSMEDLMRGLLSSQGAKEIPAKGVPSGSALRLQANFTSLDEFTREEVFEAMMVSYKHCVANLRSSQRLRRIVSLQTVKPLNFSREIRKLIPDHVMKKVANLNLLDSELYAHAKVLFQQQQTFLKEGIFFTKQSKTFSLDGTKVGWKDSPGFTHRHDNSEPVWGLTTLWVCMIIMVLGLVIFATRRRGNRVKEF